MRAPNETSPAAAALATPRLPMILDENSDAAIVLCRQWLALQAESRGLQRRWSDLESLFIRDYGWSRLSDDDRARVPGAQELGVLDARIEELAMQAAGLLGRMPEPATNEAAVIANLTVAATLLGPYVQPEAYRILVGAIDDLIALVPPKDTACPDPQV